MASEQIYLGLDLGSTVCSLALFTPDSLILAPVLSVPLVLSFPDDHSPLIGLSSTSPCLLNLERLVSHRFGDVHVSVGSCSVTETLSGCPEVVIHGHRYSPDDLLSLVFQRLLALAHTQFPTLTLIPYPTIIAVPPYYSDDQRQTVKQAGELAGLNLVRMVNNTFVAAIWYGLVSDAQSNVMVVHVGGKTVCATVLDVEDEITEICGCSGRVEAGGNGVTDYLAARCAEVFSQLSGKDLKADRLGMESLWSACEQAKIALSAAETAEIRFSTSLLPAGTDFATTISRRELDAASEPLLRTVLAAIEAALIKARVEKEQVDKVALEGGTSVIPVLKREIARYFGGKEVKAEAGAVIASAAAKMCMELSIPSQVSLRDIPGLWWLCTLSLGLETDHGLMTPVIHRNSTLPASRCYTLHCDSSPDQSSVLIKVYTGECRFARDNFLLEEIMLYGVKTAPQGGVSINVQFEVNEIEDFVRVTASDLHSEATVSRLVATLVRRISNCEMVRIIKDAERTDFEYNTAKQKVKQAAFAVSDACKDESRVRGMTIGDRGWLMVVAEKVATWADENGVAGVRDLEEKYQELQDAWKRVTEEKWEPAGTSAPPYIEEVD